jgi:hypothetical protein
VIIVEVPGHMAPVRVDADYFQVEEYPILCLYKRENEAEPVAMFREWTFVRIHKEPEQ